MMPFTFCAFVIVPFQNINANIVRNIPVVCRKLAQRFQHINSNRQIWSASLFCCHRPTVFRAKLSDSAPPFLFVIRNVSQFFAGNWFANILF